MKINEEKLKQASKADILKEISLVDNEIADEMYPVSAYRYYQLSEYKKRLEEELQIRDAKLSTKKLSEAALRMAAMIPDFSKSGRELRAKVKNEYEEELKHLNELATTA